MSFPSSLSPLPSPCARQSSTLGAYALGCRTRRLPSRLPLLLQGSGTARIVERGPDPRRMKGAPAVEIRRVLASLSAGRLRSMSRAPRAPATDRPRAIPDIVVLCHFNLFLAKRASKAGTVILQSPLPGCVLVCRLAMPVIWHALRVHTNLGGSSFGSGIG